MVLMNTTGQINQSPVLNIQSMMPADKQQQLQLQQQIKTAQQQQQQQQQLLQQQVIGALCCTFYGFLGLNGKCSTDHNFVCSSVILLAISETIQNI